jgi:3-hydroxyacyl-[acyl-carrier-protein] dehydratase
VSIGEESSPIDRGDTVNLIEIAEILKYLPHRYPFLLIDRVIAFEPSRFLTGLKNVSFNEPYFMGHFPGHPIMPGVLILEALAQATGILAFKTDKDLSAESAMYYLVGVDNARFKRPVIPGDQLILEVTLERSKRGVGRFSARAKVDGKIVASAGIMCAKQEIEP